MPWKETDPMTERVQFMAAYLSQMYSMTEWHEVSVRAFAGPTAGAALVGV